LLKEERKCFIYVDKLEIPKNGDLLRRIQLKVDLPTLSINYNNPPFSILVYE
jgi:hypothetical protein